MEMLMVQMVMVDPLRVLTVGPVAVTTSVGNADGADVDGGPLGGDAGV
jgi:hypothetical protein